MEMIIPFAISYRNNLMMDFEKIHIWPEREKIQIKLIFSGKEEMARNSLVWSGKPDQIEKEDW